MGTLNFGGFKLDTTYPREGTETFCLRRSVRRWRTQLIPARGRKRLRRIGRSSRVPDTTYPREGTETGMAQAPGLGHADTTYPREGTETCIPL